MSDLISRQDAIDTVEELNRKVNDGRENDTICTSDVLRRINALPSADRPTGEWIRSLLLPNGWHCSHCDAPVMTDDIDEMLFCPNCGAKMGVNK